MIKRKKCLASYVAVPLHVQAYNLIERLGKRQIAIFKILRELNKREYWMDRFLFFRRNRRRSKFKINDEYF